MCPQNKTVSLKPPPTRIAYNVERSPGGFQAFKVTYAGDRVLSVEPITDAGAYDLAFGRVDASIEEACS